MLVNAFRCSCVTKANGMCFHLHVVWGYVGCVLEVAYPTLGQLQGKVAGTECG
jgi:hypothetical protein